MNAVMVLHPRREGGVWLFDDPAAGLVREPFVAGIPEMIERLVADIPNAADGFAMLFAPTPFPGHQIRIDKDGEEYGGTWYRCDAWAMRGWLCPALFAYFPTAPESIYIQAQEARA